MRGGVGSAPSWSPIIGQKSLLGSRPFDPDENVHIRFFSKVPKTMRVALSPVALSDY